MALRVLFALLTSIPATVAAAPVATQNDIAQTPTPTEQVQRIDGVEEKIFTLFKRAGCTERDASDQHCTVRAVPIELVPEPDKSSGAACAATFDALTDDQFVVAGRSQRGMLARVDLAVRPISERKAKAERLENALVLFGLPAIGKAVEPVCVPATFMQGGYTISVGRSWRRDLTMDPNTLDYLKERSANRLALGALFGKMRYFKLVQTDWRKKPDRMSPAELDSYAAEKVPTASLLSWKDVMEGIFGQQTNSLLAVRIISRPGKAEILDERGPVGETMKIFQASQKKLASLRLRQGKKIIPLNECKAVAWDTEVEFRCDFSARAK